MKSALVTLLCAATAVVAAPRSKRQDYYVKDEHIVPAEWTQLERADPDHVLNLRIGLKQSSFAELERHLYEVSDPTHSRYGQHLSSADVHALVAPHPQSIDSVHTWLGAHGITEDDVTYSPARDWIIVALAVSKVEDLLDTEYHVYEDDDGHRVVRTSRYSLPGHLHGDIDVIQPTNYFGNPKAMTRTSRLSPVQPTGDIDLYPASFNADSAETSLSKACNASAVTSLCLRTLYRTVNYKPQVPDVNSAAFTAYDGETANISDFHIYLSKQRPDASQSYVYNYTTINGGPNDQNPDTPKQQKAGTDLEANLDSQTIGGIVYPTNIQAYSTGGLPPFKADKGTPTDSNEPYLAWLHYMLTLDSPPHTISTSYGDDEQSVPPAYAQRVCQEMAQLGAKGVSLFFSAGDDGVGPNGTCYSNDGKNTRMFIPEFPTSCPYVTSVGATRNINPEIVAFDVGNGYVSGGGVSNYFARPSYQTDAVDAYLKSIGNLHGPLYNHTGRAYPDIAAQGYHFVTTWLGGNVGLDGTSASSPTASAVIALVNDALIALGKPPLGFLNPALYKTLYKGFNDITSGSIYGCGTSGFPAAKGWDLASGWGTPDFINLRVAAGAVPGNYPYRT